MNLHVVAARAAAQRAVRRADGLLEQRAEVLIELGGPATAEHALLPEDPVGVQRLLGRGDVESLHDHRVPFLP